MLKKRIFEEPLPRKVVFVAAFLVAAILVFFLSAPLAGSIRARSDWIATLPVQAVLALPALFLVFWIEDKVLRRLTKQNVFSTIYPVTIGAYVGYLLHYG